MIAMKNFCEQASISKWAFQVQLMKSPAIIYLEQFSMKAKSLIVQYATVQFLLHKNAKHSLPWLKAVCREIC